MTMHQLYYTSCEDGLEGIQGFQISAVTPGAPKPLVELAVRASAYEVSPGLSTQAGQADLSTFPVAFGYVPSGPAAALFQSRYTGSDFTGRTGNYFAHALLLDDAERELGGVLPIDLWRSPTWVHTRQNGTELPPLASIAPGDGTDPTTVRRFLSTPGRTECLAGMVAAVQRVLTGGRGRVVLVVADDQTAARWLAALCRSFPRALGLGISFVTYTSRPEDAGVLVSCTTPDVHLPTYGDFTTVDLTDGSAAGEPTRYSATLARLWAAGAVASSLRLAEEMSRPPAAAELDAFAVVVECAGGAGAAEPVPEPLLLDAVGLAVDRLPGVLGPAGWQRVADLLRDGGGPSDLERWSEHLQAAERQREPVAADLLSAYYVGALTAPRPTWLPSLDDRQLGHVAASSVVPAITGAGAAPLVERLGKQPRLLEATVRALEHRVADPPALTAMVSELDPEAARLCRRAGAGGRVALLAELVLARDGREDKVTALSHAVADRTVQWWDLGAVLWPAEPTTEEAERALRDLHADVLRDTGLLDRIVARVLLRVERDDLRHEDARVVTTLLDPRLVSALRPADVKLLTATDLVGRLRRSTPGKDADRLVTEGLRLHSTLPPAVAGRVLAGIAEFVARAETTQHRELLELALRGGDGRFLTAYREQARARLAKASPNQVAPVIVMWWSLTDARARRDLVNGTLAEALGRRRGKQLDKIGDLLVATANKLAIDVDAPKGGWRKWWQGWRSTHERRGLLGFLRPRRSR